MDGYKEAESLLSQGVKVLCGGFPCQDISFAGLGEGIKAKRSGLWKAYLRTIRIFRPDYAIVENVAALLTRGMGVVLGDLANFGYDTEWHCIPASYCGLPQERDRLWIIADTDKNRKCGLVTSENFSKNGQGRTGSQKDLLSIIDSPFECGESWPKPLICRMDDRVPDRVDRIGALGNAVVPQIPEIIGRAIMETQQLEAAGRK